jgi:CheY-like chemotaxis protein
VATILVVQADPVLRASWTSTLEACGHSVLAVKDVPLAVVRAREGGVDTVVLDTSDPDRSARALLEALQRLPEPPPLILVSSSPQAPEQSAHLGAAAFVPKPCLPDDVALAVEKVVSGRRPRSIVDDEDTEKRRLSEF